MKNPHMVFLSSFPSLSISCIVVAISKIDVLAKMGVLGGRGDATVIRAATDNGAGDNAGFQWVSTEFLAQIKGPSVVLIGMTD